MATHTNSIIANILEILNNIYLLGQDMKTTIIVPAYRAEKYLDECLTSLINQNAQNNKSILKIIVVCDGCEWSYQVAKKYAGKNVFVCLTETNNGAYHAINLGLTLCDLDSDLIGCCGADDVWHIDRLRETERVAKGRLGKMVAYRCLSVDIDENGKEIGRAKPVNSGQFIYDSSVFKKLGMYRPWKCGADTEFWNRARAFGVRLNVIRKPLFYYRRHGQCLTINSATASGSHDRDFAVSEIERLRKSGFTPAFQWYEVEEYTVACESISIEDKISPQQPNPAH